MGDFILAIDQGTTSTRAILFDTEQTRIDGNGTLNLRDETLDLLLDPTQKKPGAFSLHSAIRVQGALRHPVFALEDNAGPRTVAGQEHMQCPRT